MLNVVIFTKIALQLRVKYPVVVVGQSLEAGVLEWFVSAV
jgi:hypothetical protein